MIAAYGGQRLAYGPEYVIPKPFDPRLITVIPVAVAKAAMESGVARRPIEDLDAYREKLDTMMNRQGFIMKPILDRARANPLKVAFAEGEDLRVLRAVVACLQEGICKPILIGRRKRISEKVAENNLPLDLERDVEIIEPMNNPYYEECWRMYHELRGREGVDPQEAKIHMNTRPTVLASMLVKLGHADTMLCGTLGRYDRHLRRVKGIFGTVEGMDEPAAMNMVISPKGTVFITDTHVHQEPNAREMTEITLHAASLVERLGITPKVALVSHSNFGSRGTMQSSRTMSEALPMIRARAPGLMVEGEMQADAALSEDVRNIAMPGNALEGSANILVMPNIDAANISYNLLKVVSDGNVVGPMLMGVARPVAILTKVATARRILNMAAVVVTETQAYYAREQTGTATAS